MLSEQDFTQLTNRLQSVGGSLHYPPTPDLAARFARKSLRQRPRTFAWALAALLVALVSLLAVPEVRARVLEFLQIGGVRILVPQPTSSAPVVAPTATSTPFPKEILNSVLDLDGETTFDEARQAANFPIGLPTYPTQLGEPDKVFLQKWESGSFVVLAWLGEEGRAETVLYILGPGVSLTKGPPTIVETTEVNGNEALWVLGDYLVSVDGFDQPARFVHGPVLIWEEDGLTYRLEADLSLEEMVRIAESVQP